MESDNPDTDRQDLDLNTFITTLNEKLSSAGTNNAELAFGLGCGVSLVPIGILLLVLYMLGVRGWVGLSLIALFGILLATAISTYIASRARMGAIKQTYMREIAPQIHQYLNVHKLDLDEFTQAADRLLPPEAPIVKRLATENPSNEVRED